MPEQATAMLWVLNGLFAILFAGFGWWAKTLWDAVQQLRRDLSDISVHIARDYTTNARFESTMHDVFTKLDKIIDLVGQKADRK